jgi:hypothetical protein
MKTAKQIIEPLIFSDELVIETVGEDIRFVSANDAINAMEKYAKQYHESRMKDELIDFQKYFHTTYLGIEFTNDEDFIINDYLATRKNK